MLTKAPKWIADAVLMLASRAKADEVRDYVLCVRCDGRAELQAVDGSGHWTGTSVLLDSFGDGNDVFVLRDVDAMLGETVQRKRAAVVDG